MPATKSLSSAPGLKGKLSELAGQLAAVQNENEAIRGRYLELEDAWQGMIEENKNMHQANDRIRGRVSECESQNREKDAEIESLEADVQRLTGLLTPETQKEMKAKAELQEEHRNLGKKSVECDVLRRETLHLDEKGIKLREDWDDKVYRLQRAEEARDHYRAELTKLSDQYTDLTEKLSMVAMEDTRTPSIQSADAPTELLSTLLHRIYDEQEPTNAQYARIGAANMARQPLSPRSGGKKSPRSPGKTRRL
jgi:chromosome segregation ATPase